MTVIGSYTVDCGICDTTVDLPVTTTLVNDEEHRRRNEVGMRVSVDPSPLADHLASHDHTGAPVD